MADITKSNIEHDANSTNNTKDNIIKEIRQNKHMNLSILKIQLSERNWADWQRHIMPILRICQVWGYADRSIEKPDLKQFLKSAKNWTNNDDTQGTREHVG